MFSPLPPFFARAFVLCSSFLLASLLIVPAAEAEVTAFKQAVAEAAAKDRDLAGFYQANGYRGIWTGKGAEDRRRRQALLRAIESAQTHGLPVARYDAPGLLTQMQAARTPRERGQVEVALSRSFLQLARDLQSGALIPAKVDGEIKRQVPYRARASYLANFIKSNPDSFFRALPPQSREYARLMRAKLQLEKTLAQGGWGPSVPAETLRPGASGPAVIALRNRLIAMGYLKRSAKPVYDGAIQQAVQRFQKDHGLTPDGVAGPVTMQELNISVQARLQSVIVAMERERWINQPLGKRHVLVNLTDFSARIVDDGRVTFETRAVIGKNDPDRRSPEFSDMMEFMVINPTWNVPRSIAVKEYLPKMQRNRNAASHLRIYDRRGRKISRGAINFRAYTARNFPYAIKQPPSRKNALGLVKFMFPNTYNIYLHDTPSKSLFQRETRDFSHGCIRLHQPFEFAYALLEKQESDPETFFRSRLDTGRETVVSLNEPVPVHIIYRTASTQAKGRIQYRRDIYGRDAEIWKALSKAGVSLSAVRG